MVGFVGTTDAARSRQYYEQQLGFRVVRDDGLAIMLDAVGHPIRIQRLKEHRPQKFTVLGWNVADLDTVLDGLATRGVQPKHYGFPMQDARGVARFDDGTQLVWLEDPDGNILSIAQMPR